MFDQLATNEGARHDCDVEPQPLLADEAAALLEVLAVLGQQRAAKRARRGHRVGSQQQEQGELARFVQDGDGGVRNGCAGAGEHQIAHAPVAEQGNEVGDQSEDGLDDPREVEHGEVGRDLERAPAIDLQVVAERLEDDADPRLADAFDGKDDGEENHQPADGCQLRLRA
jgi:hypothetical protein